MSFKNHICSNKPWGLISLHMSKVHGIIQQGDGAISCSLQYLLGAYRCNNNRQRGVLLESVKEKSHFVLPKGCTVRREGFVRNLFRYICYKEQNN